jgi:hypothetical protein
MLFVTPSSKEDCSVNEPAIRISSANEPTKLQNCEIFKVGNFPGIVEYVFDYT